MMMWFSPWLIRHSDRRRCNFDFVIHWQTQHDGTYTRFSVMIGKRFCAITSDFGCDQRLQYWKRNEISFCTTPDGDLNRSYKRNDIAEKPWNVLCVFTFRPFFFSFFLYSFIHTIDILKYKANPNIRWSMWNVVLVLRRNDSIRKTRKFCPTAFINNYCSAESKRFVSM